MTYLEKSYEFRNTITKTNYILYDHHNINLKTTKISYYSDYVRILNSLPFKNKSMLSKEEFRIL